ncbi:unnamed protein product, partial [marine sediment metagenome]
HKLLQAFEQQWFQLSGKPARLSTQSFNDLAREQAQLLFRQVIQMAKIEAEHSKSGGQILTFEDMQNGVRGLDEE